MIAENGIGTLVDFDTAVPYYKQSSEHFPGSPLCSGQCWHIGTGIPVDVTFAAQRMFGTLFTDLIIIGNKKDEIQFQREKEIRIW
jgi:hypothetical protein